MTQPQALPENRELTVQQLFEVEQTWCDFWAPICMPDGQINPLQIKCELHDFRALMANTAKVYEHVTGGKISLAHTVADDVIAVADDCVQKAIQQAIEDFWKEGDFEGLHAGTVETLKQYITGWFTMKEPPPLFK